MNFRIFLFLVFVAGAVLIIGKLFSARKRRNLLVQIGRVSAWKDIEKQPDSFSKIVQTNFGYGKEVWVLTKGGDEIDLKLRCFKTGVLIVPRPKVSDLERFCQLRGIPLELMVAI